MAIREVVRVRDEVCIPTGVRCVYEDTEEMWDFDVVRLLAWRISASDWLWAGNIGAFSRGDAEGRVGELREDSDKGNST